MRRILRGLLRAALPGDGWSSEFVGALDAEAWRVEQERGGLRGRIAATLWYTRQLASPATLRFILRMRARARAASRSEPRGGALDGLITDLHHGARSLRRDPFVTLFVAATLAVGIGSVTAVYDAADRLFLSPAPHVADSDAVMRVYLEVTDGGSTRTSPWMPLLTAEAIGTRVSGLDGVTLHRSGEELVGTGPSTSPAAVTFTDLHYFPLLGPRMVAGRAYGPGDAVDRQVAVVSEDFARRSLEGVGNALGRPLEIGSGLVTVVGVVPSGFAGGGLDRIDVWTPLDVDRAGSRNWWVTGRLASGRTAASVREEAQAAHAAQDPGRFFQWARNGEIRLAGLDTDLEGNRSVERAIAGLLLAVSVVVLVIAWVNALNLLLARLTRRRAELDIRVALGIGRFRLARQLVLEGALLGLLGALASLPVAWATGRSIRAVLLPDVAWMDPAAGLGAVGIAGLLGGVSALVLGALAFVSVAGRRTSTTLRGGRSSASRSGLAIQRSLATAQVALSAGLLLCAALFVRSFLAMDGTELGIDADGVHAIDLRSLDPSAWPDEDPDRMYRTALEEARQVEPSTRWAMSIGLPFSSNFGMSLHLPDRDSVPELPGGGPFVTMVSDGYFDAMGTRIVRGTGISREAVVAGRREVVVGASTAASLWPAEEPLGACLRVGGAETECWTVVGVAEDVHQVGYREPPSHQIYAPIGSIDAFSGATLLARTPRGTAPSATVRDALVALDPVIDFVEVRRLDSFLAAEIRPWRLGASMLSLASLLAVSIALAGVVAVLSYLVAQRRREIGVRLALGAGTGSIRALILRIGLRTGVVGVAVGFAVVALVRGRIAPLLFETPVLDPISMVGVAAVLVGAAVAACLLPARSASRVDPLDALRSEG